MKLPFFVSRSSKHDPLTSIRFLVMFNITTLGFQSVSGISKESSFEFINEGGRNGYQIMLPKPQNSPHKLTFKRGYEIHKLGIASLMGNYVGVRAIEAKGALGTILVLDEEQDIKAIYSFVSQGVIEWELSDLDASKSNLLIETFTITHKGLTNVPIPPMF